MNEITIDMRIMESCYSQIIEKVCMKLQYDLIKKNFDNTLIVDQLKHKWKKKMEILQQNTPKLQISQKQQQSELKSTKILQKRKLQFLNSIENDELSDLVSSLSSNKQIKIEKNRAIPINSQNLFHQISEETKEVENQNANLCKENSQQIISQQFVKRQMTTQSDDQTSTKLIQQHQMNIMPLSDIIEPNQQIDQCVENKGSQQQLVDVMKSQQQENCFQTDQIEQKNVVEESKNSKKDNNQLIFDNLFNSDEEENDHQQSEIEQNEPVTDFSLSSNDLLDVQNYVINDPESPKLQDCVEISSEKKKMNSRERQSDNEIKGYYTSIVLKKRSNKQKYRQINLSNIFAKINGQEYLIKQAKLILEDKCI